MTRHTPITRHLMRVAASAASVAEPGETRGEVAASTQRGQGRAYEMMRAKLATDQRRLKETQSVERKVEIKREILPDYVPYISEVLERDAGGQDDVVTTIMLWRLDARDMGGAMEIARYAIRHGLTMPAHFDRTLPATVAEGFADTADVPSGLLAEVIDLTAPFDMVDQIRAKLFKAYGVALTAADPDAALAAFRRAFELNDKIGVKRDIARLEALLSDKESAPGPDGEGSDA
ncbi:TPA: terminase [Burkholderia territorii]|uniref:phage terminase small subunit n=1 Tax=Burkholderia territorii TaxID=1503055 RepID=UPI0011CB8B94|nr:phage terminase small subunit [Burkholderia territorii]TXG20405.1 terminase [Burkholderia territorii]HDR8859352.1 terminase [Burkholderia territorii]HDR8866123.1 terminase [Burkholderia territorii]HDR8871861.1 terminase [Burkholderia territorii]HDR8877079.1 terminase [Burkholderia territorii]